MELFNKHDGVGGFWVTADADINMYFKEYCRLTQILPFMVCKTHGESFKRIQVFAENHAFSQKMFYTWSRFAEREIFCGGLLQVAKVSLKAGIFGVCSASLYYT